MFSLVWYVALGLLRLETPDLCIKKLRVLVARVSVDGLRRVEGRRIRAYGQGYSTIFGNPDSTATLPP